MAIDNQVHRLFPTTEDAMITIVDRNDSHIVQKVVQPKKAPRYQVVPKDGLGDTAKVTVRSTLSEARALIGKGPSGRALAH